MDNTEITNRELTEEELKEVAGGCGYSHLRTRFVCNLKSNYLAIRSYPSYAAQNELGSLYNGQVVYSTEKYDGYYVWVYANTNADPVFHKNPYSGYGWVNSKYLSGF